MGTVDINGNKICLTPDEPNVPVCFENTQTYEWGPKEPVAIAKYVDFSNQNFFWYSPQNEIAGQAALNYLPGIFVPVRPEEPETMVA